MCFGNKMWGLPKVFSAISQVDEYLGFHKTGIHSLRPQLIIATLVRAGINTRAPHNVSRSKQNYDRLYAFGSPRGHRLQRCTAGNVLIQALSGSLTMRLLVEFFQGSPANHELWG